ncbi:uncharacterized protein LOC130809230 [Amaranthus tricolor]|uniref:uncharacterized protein LOC130809230 n=1 Tax=Amaranthus tricolor TaxID=29722 RepID=UPI002584C52C|nr:uncharacterized protein LOC130809230 [Amaranthus tricolor]
MAIFRLKPGDISAFKLLFLLAIMYGLMSVLVYSVLHMKFIKPLGIDAPLDRFSEARAIEHIRVLTKDIVGRHEGRPGLKQAADYIKSELELLKDRADSSYRIEVEESMVNGSFNMMFLGHSISLTYRAHTNVLMRLSSVNSTKTDASVLVNGHFDSALNSPGAGDCGSCVASMLELARLMVDSGWNPPRPIIFLFNGAEELFMLGSHGFITTHRWRDTVGAFINIEASGSGGPDVVCQSGPGSWPAKVYSQSAVYPMAQSSAQDVFGVIPGDTDYRILAQDYGNIPGLDVIFLLGGYFYHTSYDTLERLLPGSIQARGDNLFSVVKAFASSSMLRNTSERQSFESSTGNASEERAIFFDYMTWFMVYYPKNISAVLHILPIVIFLVVPIFLQPPYFGLCSCCKIYCDFLKGMLQHFIASIMAIVVSVTFAVLRLLCSGHAMNWFANPYLAFMMFVPCSVVGLLIPRYVWRCFRLFQDVSVQKVLTEAQFDEAGFFGAFGFYALLTMVYFLAGLGGGYLTFFVSVSMLLAWLSTQLLSYCNHSLRSVLVYTFPLLPCLTYSVHFSGFIMQFLIEKMGMIGSIPPPYGYYLQDIVVAAMVGLVTGWCLGPLLPVIGDWLARSSIMQALVQLSVLALALSSGFFPYSVDAPKRVVMQHTIVTTDSMQILGSSYDFTVVDSNSLSFLFKHAWNASEDLKIGPGSFEPTRDKWLAIFPVSFLLSKSLKFPVKHEEILKQYNSFPRLSRVDHEEFSDARVRKVHLELTLGSLKEVWVTVLNVTGPLSRWSFADQTLPAPETIDGGPLSYICRLSGASNEKWAFWLEANSSEPLRVEVAVLDQYMVQEAKELKLRFPDWVDVVAYTSFMSSYSF